MTVAATPRGKLNGLWEDFLRIGPSFPELIFVVREIPHLRQWAGEALLNRRLTVEEIDEAARVAAPIGFIVPGWRERLQRVREKAEESALVNSGLRKLFDYIEQRRRGVAVIGSKNAAQLLEEMTAVSIF